MSKLYLIRGRIFYDTSDKLALLSGRIVQGTTTAAGGGTEVVGLIDELVLDDTALATISVDVNVTGLIDELVLDDTALATISADVNVTGLIDELVLDDTALATISADVNVECITDTLVLDDTALATISVDVNVQGLHTLGPELSSDPTCSGPITEYTYTGGWTIAGGNLIGYSMTDLQLCGNTAVSLKKGYQYEITVDVANVNGTGLQVWEGSSSEIGELPAVGEYTFTHQATADGNRVNIIKFVGGTVTSCTIDNFSVKQIGMVLDDTELATIDYVPAGADTNVQGLIQELVLDDTALATITRDVDVQAVTQALVLDDTELATISIGTNIQTLSQSLVLDDTELATITIDTNVQALSQALVLDDTALATITRDVGVQALSQALVLDDTGLATITLNLGKVVEGITDELILDDTELATFTRDVNVECTADVLYLQTGLCDINGSLERNRKRGSWKYDKKKTSDRFKQFEHDRGKDAEADAEFMRMLLGEDLQEGETLVVDRLHKSKKLRVRLDVQTDVNELAAEIKAAVPFPVIIEQLPRKKKRRVVTKEVIMRDDAEVMRRLFDIY